jgi:hypothetical protein
MATPDPTDQILASDDVPFADLSRHFDQALGAGGGHTFDLRIAGRRLRIRVVGDAWAQIVSRAMGHLQTRNDQGIPPDITIDALDIRASGLPGVSRPAFAPSAPPILMKTSADGRYIGEERHHGATWLSRSESRIVGFTECASRLNLDERARPFHKMLSAWLEDHGVQFIHSGLIREREKGILFVGNGGAGKSTSSISCLRAGMKYLGDDFIGLGVDEGRFVGYGLYASCLLNEHHLQRFPDLAALGLRPNHAHEHKCVLYLADAFADRICERSEIDAIALPRVVDSESTTFRRASPADTLKAIAPTSVMYLTRPTRAAFERLVDLVQRTPGYWLELGRRVDLIPDAVHALAESLHDQRGEPGTHATQTPSIQSTEA